MTSPGKKRNGRREKTKKNNGALCLETTQQHRDVMESLKNMAARAHASTLASPEARALINRAIVSDSGGPDTKGVDLDLMDAVKIAEIGHIEAHGRISGEGAPEPGDNPFLGPRRVVNSFGLIDNARFVYFDPEDRRVKIRIDHSEILEFWMELSFTLEQLEKWIGTLEQPETRKTTRKRRKTTTMKTRRRRAAASQKK